MSTKTKLKAPNRLLTSEDAVSFFGLDRQGLSQPTEAIRWLCRTGRLRFTKVGRYLRFRPEWLEELIERNAVIRDLPSSRCAQTSAVQRRDLH